MFQLRHFCHCGSRIQAIRGQFSISYQDRHRAPSSGLVACGLLFDSPENCRRVPPGEAAVSSTTSSSIVNNSDDESGSGDGENDEAQSSYKGPLDMMNALEEVLPMRRWISKFYHYKSKSFTCLAEASSSSNIKDLAKPDKAYVRKRRNLHVGEEPKLSTEKQWERDFKETHLNKSKHISFGC
ncbi:unnamed protein product [Prunus armeniaca]|uniref:Uncharacterized protein n=1 Tax=Prunus armeniaca TaxID=36596 RepID=A0A6J5V9V2_PRUAR|nr:unnamed protein product [Prunus armeniaca]CAB4316258.1 unnamed protein product [Prunus armeniaca]